MLRFTKTLNLLRPADSVVGASPLDPMGDSASPDSRLASNSILDRPMKPRDHPPIDRDALTLRDMRLVRCIHTHLVVCCQFLTRGVAVFIYFPSKCFKSSSSSSSSFNYHAYNKQINIHGLPANRNGKGCLTSNLWQFNVICRVVQKLAQFLYALILSNINRFSKLFHCQNQEKICNNTITKEPITPQVCRCITS